MKAFNHEKINEISIFYFSHELTITGSNSSNVFVFHDIFYDIVFVAKKLIWETASNKIRAHYLLWIHFTFWNHNLRYGYRIDVSSKHNVLHYVWSFILIKNCSNLDRIYHHIRYFFDSMLCFWYNQIAFADTLINKLLNNDRHCQLFHSILMSTWNRANSLRSNSLFF